MKSTRFKSPCGLAILWLGLTALVGAQSRGGPDEESEVEQTASSPSGPVWETYLSPAALAVTADGKRLFVACATANRVAVFDTALGRVSGSIPVPDAPLALALSRDGSRVYVACAAPKSTVCLIDTTRRQIVERIAAGHTASAVVLSPDEKRLYACNRFNHDVSVLDLQARRELTRVRVEREPVAAALTPDGKNLVVANHLPSGSANRLHAGAMVTVIDTEGLKVRKHIRMPLGAGFLRGVAISPNGRFAAVTHVRAAYWMSTTSVELGRINGSALSVLDLERLDTLGMVFLDQTMRGGANPGAVVWTDDGETIVVAHAGAHEISLVDAPRIADPASFSSTRISAYEPTDKGIAPVPRQRPVRMRQRLALPGNGPRALALAGSQLYVANYFSDNLSRVDLSALNLKAEPLSLGTVPEPSVVRQGERLFNDAQLCHQGWQSCASCHDADGRADGLNWDLLNDGADNPKNTRSLVWAHRSGPAMALGVRTNAEAAVRAGLHHILFTEQPETVPAAIDAWLQSLEPVPSPHIVNGRLSEAARRGEALFRSPRTGCVDCHPPPWFTDMTAHDVGTAAKYHSMFYSRGADQPSDRFYSPALTELWRTAPYLHDGSAATLRELLTTSNPNDRHGRTKQLTPQELQDLEEYLLAF